jgi:hypothetical protein
VRLSVKLGSHGSLHESVFKALHRHSPISPTKQPTVTQIKISRKPAIFIAHFGSFGEPYYGMLH